MRHHHVPIRAGGFVECGPPIERQCLRHVDLNVVDEIPVPDRLEQSVGETKRQDVLRRFFSKEVVDPEDLRLLEHLVQLRIQRHCAREIGAERLFHHDARSLDQPRFAEHPHRGQRRGGRHAHVVESLAFAVERSFRVIHRRLYGGGSSLQRHIVQRGSETLPIGVRDLARGELVECRAGELAEAVRIEFIERDADDAAVRNESRGQHGTSPAALFVVQDHPSRQRARLLVDAADRRQALPLPSLVTFAELSPHGSSKQEPGQRAGAQIRPAANRVCHSPVHDRRGEADARPKRGRRTQRHDRLLRSAHRSRFAIRCRPPSTWW